MTGARGITEAGLNKIATLSQKAQRTEKQQAELERLIAKRDAVVFSSTCLEHLMKCFIQVKYDRNYLLSNKYLTKGSQMENDSITLYSRVKVKVYKKNTDRLSNDYIEGEPDLIEGGSILNASRVIDTKTPWDIYSFFSTITKALNEAYYYQLQGYSALTGADDLTLAYCLVNAPASLIKSEKYKLYHSLACPDDDDPEYRNGCIEIEKNMIVDMQQFRKDNPFFDLDCSDWSYDIPRKERVIEFAFKRDEQVIKQIYQRVVECRQWLNWFAQQQADQIRIVTNKAEIRKLLTIKEDFN